jgi:hypothetical protein
MNPAHRQLVLVLSFGSILAALFWISGCAGFAEPVAPLSVTPTNLSVSAKVGTTSSQPVNVTNLSGDTVSISQALLTGAGFSVSGLTTPMTLNSGQTQSFAVKFAAGSVGSVNGSLAIMTDSRHRPVVVSLHGSGSSTTPDVSSVSISPSAVTAPPSGKVQFTAAVQGATTNDSVTWTSTLGAINSTGTFTAPAAATTGTVTATSVADPTKFASAVVTVVAASTPSSPSAPGPTVTGITISPTSTTTTTGGSVLFSAAVQGTTPDKAVIWRTSSGSITSAGVYTAPTTAGTSTVIATADADSTKVATAIVTVTSAPSQPQPTQPSTPAVSSVTVSPATASSLTGGTLPFTATVQGSTTNKAVTWKAALGTISATGLYTAPAKAGTDLVTATSAADPSVSGTASVTVTAPAPTPTPTPTTPTVTSVAVSPATASSVISGTLPFTATVHGSTTNTAVTWTAALGTISAAGLYTAPSKAGTDTVTATSVADPSVSGTASVTVTAPAAPPTPAPSAPSSSSCSVQIEPTGDVDNSNWLAKINEAGSKCVEITAGNYTIQPLTFPDPTNIVCDDGVRINDSSSGYGSFDAMFDINNDNLSFVGTGSSNACTITMTNRYGVNKGNPDENTNQYNHCFEFQGGSNQVLTGVLVSGCGGDGINLDDTQGATITNVCSSANIRQGYSVTGSINATISGGCAINGPDSGLDIEPETAGVSITLTIEGGFYTSNNAGGGTSFGLYAVGPTGNVNITANGLASNNDNSTGIFFTNSSNGPGNDASGSITCNNCVVTGSGGDGAYGIRSDGGWQMIFNNLTVSNPNRVSPGSHDGISAAIGVGLDGGNNGPVGGVTFSNVTINGATNCTDIAGGAQGVSVSGMCGGKTIN